jgi:predicted metalloprotease with PDZ domain
MRKRNAGKSWLGSTTLSFANGGLRAGVVPFDSPLYKAGVAQEDQIVSIAGEEVSSSQGVQDVLLRHAPGAKLALRIVRRDGQAVTTAVILEEDPRIEIVPAESTGAAVTLQQRQMRTAWLASKLR